MAYNLENFSDYISRENEVLTATLFAGGDVAKFARYMSGVKGSTEVPHFSGGATIQSGSCATPSGGSTGELVTLTVKNFTVYEEFCQDDLQNKFPNTVLAPGSNNAETPKEWEEALVDTKLSSIAEQLDELYWQGDTAGGVNNLFDGFLKQIDASSDVIDGNTAGITVATGINKSNVISIVEDVRSAAPAKVKRKKEFSILVGDDVFDLYIQALKDANLYHYTPEHDEGVLRIGGSGAMLKRQIGLDGTNRIVASVGENFIVGSDLENESEVADMWYDKTSDKTYLRVKAKSGVTIQNAGEIVEFTLV